MGENEMQDTFDYIKDFGHLSFEELEFNEVDNVNLCQMFYMPIEKVSPQSFDNGAKSFREIAEDMYSFNGNKHVGPGLVLNKKISVKMMDMAKSERYSDMQVYCVRDVFKERPAVQFCAATFVLSDGTIVVVYRGTDDTIVGWKEDVDLMTKHGIPSHQLSVDYLKDVCEYFPEGDIIICGHSKGGNVALYAGLASDKAIRSRIKMLYNNEGPGFDSYAWFSTPAYKDLLPKYRHFVPTSSMIGMMLAHDNDYEVVKNKHVFGLIQHDITFWKTSGDQLARAAKLNFLGRFADRFFNKFVFGINETQLETFDKIVESVMIDGIAAAAHGLIDLPKNIQSVIKGTGEAYRSVDEEDKEILREYMSSTGDIARGAANETAKERAEERISERRSAREELASRLGESESTIDKIRAHNLAARTRLEERLEGRVEAFFANENEDDEEDAAPLGDPIPAT